MSDTTPGGTRDILKDFVDAPSWAASQEIVTQHQALLLTDAADDDFTAWIADETVTDGTANIQTLAWYRDVLQRCRSEGIEATFAHLPEPRPLNKALNAFLNADEPELLGQMIQDFPEITEEAAVELLQALIAQTQATDQEKAAELMFRVAMIEMVKVARRPIPDDLAQLLKNWIETGSWNDSKEFLVVHAERLLSDEAFEALTGLLLRSMGEDEDSTKLLLQHRTILETARAESIDAAYTELLKPSPLIAVLDALLKVHTPSELQQAIAQHPTLLEDETLDALTAMAARIEQDGNTAIAQVLRLRLSEVRRIRQQREQTSHRTTAEPPHHDEYEQTEVSAKSRGIAVGTNIGDINQTNIENYTQPKKQWQQPKRQAFRERKNFVGRRDEVDTLRKYLAAGENVAITGKITAVATLQGMGGIGKTYLARKLAVELHDNFPGGIIWIILGPEVRDESGASAPLSRLAGYAFGGQPPVGQLDPETVAAWLEQMASGRLLVVFDDVWYQAPLRFLDRALPADVVRLVTTRYANIAQTLGGQSITLGRLTPQDGLELLEDRLGCQNNSIYQADLEKLVALLDGHALALDIAAALIKKPSRVQAVLKNLQHGIGRGELNRLKLSEDEERDTNLELSLALSYERMTSEQRNYFRTLGVFAAETVITPEAAAAVWSMDDLDAAQNALFELEDLALLTEVIESSDLCYRQHGLLRVYARALLDKEGELTNASWAHAHYYTNLVVRTEIPDYPLLDQHIPNLLAALQWASDHEPLLFSQLLERSFQFLLVRGQSALLETYLPKAVAAAAAVGDKRQQANLLQSLGDLESRLGNIDQARGHYDAALPLYRAERARLGEANLLRSLGDLERGLGNIDQARGHYDAALPLYRLERDRLGEANIYRSLAEQLLVQREWAEAQTYYERALPLYVAEREPLGHAGTLLGLGRAKFELGGHDAGMQDVQQAAALFRSVYSEEGAGYAEQSLAEMQARLSPDASLFTAFLSVSSSQEMFQLAQQYPQLLTDEWLSMIEAIIATQQDEEIKEAFVQRLEILKQIR